MIKQLFSYAWVAGVGFIVDFGTLYLFTEYFKTPYLLSAFLGFVLGLICNFVLSEKYVFEGSRVQSPWARFSLFGLIGLVGLGILELCMWALVDLFKTQYLIAKIAATVVVYLWNFFARRLMYKND